MSIAVSAPQSSSTDAAWVAPSWEQVVEQHSARVYRLAYRLSGNAHDAEDITQETFIRVFRSLDGYRPGSFEGWLHRITTNVFLDLVRRRQRIRMESLPEETERHRRHASPAPEQASTANLDRRPAGRARRPAARLPGGGRAVRRRRACRTRKSAPPWESSWARFAREFTAAARSSRAALAHLDPGGA